MNWITLALLGTAVMGFVNILDAHLMAKRMTLTQYMFGVAIFNIFIGTGLLLIFPPVGFTFWPLAMAILSGLTRTTGVLIMNHCLRTQDVSRIAPVVYAYPVFVAIMALPILGETLDLLRWAAILIVVGGAVLVSIKKDQGGPARFPVKLFLALITASVLFAVMDLTSKIALKGMSFWQNFAITFLTMSATYLIFTLRPAMFREMSRLKSRNLVLGLQALDQSLVGVGVLLTMNAISQGPVSLVSAVLGSRPVFVALYAVGFSFVLPQFLTRDTGRSMLALRIAAAFVIVGGITLIYLR